MVSIQRIRIPSRLSVLAAFDACKSLESFDPTKDAYVDFGNTTDVRPFGMVYLGAKIREKVHAFKANGREIYVENCDSNSYAKHVGFYESFGVHVGKKVGEAIANQNYVPITCKWFSQLQDLASARCCPIGSIIEEDARHIAKVLTRRENGLLFDVMSYSLRELIRNVAEHSGSKAVWYAAQYWKATNAVEVVLLDNGIGVLESLNQNPDYIFAEDKDAIQAAILPSVSSKVRKGGKTTIDPYDVWQNTGYGLYVVSRICRILGSLLIASGSSAQYWEFDSPERSFDTSHRGTAVRIVFSIERIPFLKKGYLAEFVHDGECRAKEGNIGGANLASKASKLTRVVE